MFDEHRRRPGRHRERPGRGIERGRRDDRVDRVDECLVQLDICADEIGNGELDRISGRVEPRDHRVVVLIEVDDAVARVGDPHRDQPRDLVRARVQKRHPLLNVGSSLQAEQRCTAADLQPLSGDRGVERDVGRSGEEVGVREQWTLDRPVRLVLLGDRQPDAPIVRLVRDVEPVEPVAGVERVAVEGLRTQHVLSGVEEVHTLGECGDRVAEVLRAHAVVHRGVDRMVILTDVEQGLVVVRCDVDDVLLRISGVAGR